MTSEQDIGPLSDTEGGEKPVREQLRKAHITNAAKLAAASSDSATKHSEANGNDHDDSNDLDDTAPRRGRLSRKRSHEEVEEDAERTATEPLRHHTRKRSRDSTAEEDVLNNGQRKSSGETRRNGEPASEGHMEDGETNGAVKGPRAATPEGLNEKGNEAAVESISSPKTKRSRLHSTTAEATTTLAKNTELSTSANSAASVVSTEALGLDHQAEDSAPQPKEPATKIPSTSGFANASAVSPFGALAGSKSPSSEPQTSTNAFKASGFGALSGSSTSGFGSIGKNAGGFGSGGSFATGAKSPVKTNDAESTAKPATSSAFGGALGQQSAFSAAGASASAFGSASGFGAVSSGFGGGLAGTGFSSLGKGGLSSFASGKSTPLGGSSKPTKAFGSPPGDDEEGKDEEEDDDEAGAKSPLSDEADKQHAAFYEQRVETGEEEENTEFSCRAKLYNFSAGLDGNKEWRERGFGVVRFNVKKATEDETPRGRLLMRLQGSHRVVLNTPVTKGLKFGTPKGEPPEGGFMYFMGTIDGKDSLELLQLKVCRFSPCMIQGRQLTPTCR